MNKERSTLEWIAIVIVGVVLGCIIVQGLVSISPQFFRFIFFVALVISVYILWKAIDKHLTG